MREALVELSALLAEFGIRWALIGGVAANLYRRKTRMTGDVDLLLGADAMGALALLERALGSRGWSVRRATPEGDILRIHHPTLGWADLQIAGTDYQVGAIQRAVPKRMNEELVVPALTPEDLIVHKLIAGRAHDLADVEALLEADVPFDEAYVEHWASIWDVSEIWRQVRSKRPYSP